MRCWAVLSPDAPPQQRQWLKESCHQLKHALGAAEQLYDQICALVQESGRSTLLMELCAALTYFHHHQHQMVSAHYRDKHYPIGSGVTEAACKTLIKHRLCCSGMRWNEKGAAVVLSLRALGLTPTRWSQFWGKLNQYGFPIAA